ncbi:3-oxoacyl-[acyl-carrier-protein] reductase FabG [Tepiditoga spiralis]|uniref:3-oxoacyl-[acyl-carrier-protein] reductase n=1 Tax=Tepiditoga spiralis TaxID=2108365 RepID=A0A7G1G269_9BACT|nr:3-oxoacyl-[acyl-carrier-protein] reductase [Tepiditoga spiralis]BBE30318.1 3-oxoacyl-[acyl-carrier-protein] reductase FabG [Tepiditoga spiralis]
MKLNEKIAIITGASRGIGYEIAKKFVENGAKVIAFDVNEEGLKQAKNTLNNYYPYVVDVTDSKKIDETVKKINSEFGKIDILVNNAGVTKDTLLVMMKEENFDFVVNINLKGVFLVTKSVAKVMRKQKSGNIINISSIVGIEGNIGQTNYAATKAGVIGMTKTWAKEMTMRGENVRVNAIAPGFIQTAMTDKLKDEMKEAAINRMCIKRLGTAEDISKTALFLASDDSAYITGQVIRVDGGITL